MAETKSKETTAKSQPPAAPTIEERLAAAIAKRNIPRVKLEADENGYAIVDKDKHPEIYDWAVNG